MSHDKLKIGDCVVYSTKGICRITDVEEKVFDRDKRNYFVLVPIFDEMSTYYIPQDYDSEKVHINPSLTESEALDLCEYVKTANPLQWITNPSERKQLFDKIYKSGTRKEKVHLNKAIKPHEAKQKALGKRLYATDERFLRGCISVVVDELAFVLGRDRDELRCELDF